MTAKTPADLFRTHATLTNLPVEPRHRRIKGAADYLADADELGATFHESPRGIDVAHATLEGAARHESPRGIGWTCRGKRIDVAHATLEGAARHVCDHFGVPSSVPVAGWWRVTPHLAERLENEGEVIVRDAAGSHYWGCTAPVLDADNDPVACRVFEAWTGRRSRRSASAGLEVRA